ncbi:MAG TPA: hypothetical protein VJ385_20615 [Fibrobacteria bacterium]|nr:hypothetical protein [Fibrobacteria bacterium]
MAEGNFKHLTAGGFIFLHGSRETDYPGISGTGREIMDGLGPFIKEQGVKIAGACVWAYEHLGGGKVLLRAGFPIEAGPEPRDGFFVTREGEWKCVSTEYAGAMDGIAAAWDRFIGSVKAAGLKPLNINREIYRKWIAMDSPDNLTELQVQIE